MHSDKRTIKLMWDYGCWPIWQFDGEIFDNISPESLPLSAAIKTRLEAWASVPEAKLDQNYPPDTIWLSEDRRVFETEGRALWKALQGELGASYYVLYHCAAEGRVLRPEDEIVT